MVCWRRNHRRPELDCVIPFVDSYENSNTTLNEVGEEIRSQSEDHQKATHIGNSGEDGARGEGGILAKRLQKQGNEASDTDSNDRVEHQGGSDDETEINIVFPNGGDKPDEDSKAEAIQQTDGGFFEKDPHEFLWLN